MILIKSILIFSLIWIGIGLVGLLLCKVWFGYFPGKNMKGKILAFIFGLLLGIFTVILVTDEIFNNDLKIK